MKKVFCVVALGLAFTVISCHGCGTAKPVEQPIVAEPVKTEAAPVAEVKAVETPVVAPTTVATPVEAPEKAEKPVKKIKNTKESISN